jgi:hypothetical protein
VLAQEFEAAGLSTVMVTMMPFWAEKLGTPRALGVEVPFGHAFGMPGDRELQMSIVRAALSLLEEAREPGAASEVEIEWPQPSDEARKDWQPLEPSPIIRMMREQAQARVQQERGSGSDHTSSRSS